MLKSIQSQSLSKHGLRIRALLLQRGYSLSAVARALGVSPSAVHYVVNGLSSSRTIERRICQILGERREHLFPRREAIAQRTHNRQVLVAND
jgi:transcriptional regulator with XRE-family HTH domain